MNTHTSYSKLTNLYNANKRGEFTISNPDAAEMWVASEKIHGANFSITLTKDGRHYCSSRNQVLGHDSNFYGFDHADLFLAEMNKLYELLESPADKVIVFGELFGGGNYPGFSGECSPVQKGIFYDTKKRFLAFDVCAVYYEQEGHETRLYMAPTVARDLCVEAGIPFVNLHTFDNARAAIEWSNQTFNTQSEVSIANDPTNIREGNVLRPNTLTIQTNRSVNRLAIKHKHDTEKGKASGANALERSRGLTEAEAANVKSTLERLTVSKVESAISHYGADFAHFRAILTDLVNDVVGGVELSKKERGVVYSACSELLRPTLKEAVSSSVI